MDIWIPVVLAIVAAVVAPTVIGIGKWISWRREDKLKDLKTIENLQTEIKTYLQERIKDEMNKRSEAETLAKLGIELATLSKQLALKDETSSKLAIDLASITRRVDTIFQTLSKGGPTQ